MDNATPKENPQVYKVKLPDDSPINMHISSCGNYTEYLTHIVEVLCPSSRGGWIQGVGSSRRLF
jgi:hypothetical protein